MLSAAVLTAPATASAAAGVPVAGISSDSEAASTTGTRILSFRGMNLRIPPTWKAHHFGDTIQVVTGSPCTDPSSVVEPCRGFWLIGPKNIAQWDYDGEFPYIPGYAQPGCPFRNSTSTNFSRKASFRGLRQVGPGHKAHHITWPAFCEAQGSLKKINFTWREWFLPASKILVVDMWNTKALPSVLSRATWS